MRSARRLRYVKVNSLFCLGKPRLWPSIAHLLYSLMLYRLDAAGFDAMMPFIELGSAIEDALKPKSDETFISPILGPFRWHFGLTTREFVC